MRSWVRHRLTIFTQCCNLQQNTWHTDIFWSQVTSRSPIPEIIILCWTQLVAVWRSGSALVLINKVNLRRIRLVLGWVTVSGFNFWCGTFISVCNQPPSSTQPGHPFVGRCNEYRPKGVTACGWGIKAGMVRVWLAGKTVWSPCYTQTISEHFRDMA